jgi:hypothetical protein
MPIGEYCDAAFTPGGLSGHQAILVAHLVYVGAAGYWLGRAAGATPGPEARTRPAWGLPLAAVLYAICSMLWHLTGRHAFAAGDGAFSLVFLVLVAEWRTREQLPLVRWLRAAAPAIAYVPPYLRFGAPAYLAAMAAGGLLVLGNLRRLDDPGAWRSAKLALVAITLAFAGWVLDQPLCGLTGFLTGHAIDHALDGCCFFLLMRAALEAQRR